MIVTPDQIARKEVRIMIEIISCVPALAGDRDPRGPMGDVAVTAAR